jgi:hypothetical protein
MMDEAKRAAVTILCCAHLLLFFPPYRHDPSRRRWERREGALLFGNWWLSLAATAHIAMMTGHMYVNMTENATTIEQIALGPRRSSRRQGRTLASVPPPSPPLSASLHLLFTPLHWRRS